MGFNNIWGKQLFTVDGDHKFVGVIDTIWVVLTRINTFFGLLMFLIGLIIAIIALLKHESFKTTIYKTKRTLKL